MILTLLTATSLTLFSTTALAAELVEIQLLDKLDEARGYCIDIKGYKERAKFTEDCKHIPVTRTKSNLTLTKPLTRI